MYADERRQVYVILATGAAVIALMVAAVFALDLPSLVQASQPQIEEAISDAVDSALPVSHPRFDDDGNLIVEDELTLPPGIDMRGSLERGGAVEGMVGTYRMEGWALQGRAGDQFLLSFEPLAGGYTWQMTVYQPDRNMLAFTADSEAGYADFSQLLVELPADGRYVVVISAFGETGPYTLTVN
jgi:hypothetical protein